jgi:hypothetical protein
MPDNIFKWSDGILGTDANAIHDNQANEISAITAKTTPADNDLILLEDSAAGFVKKKITKANLVGTGVDANAIHKNVAAEVSTITEKTSIVDDDLILIEDSAASYAKKKLKRSNISLDGNQISGNAINTNGFGCRIERTSNQVITNNSWQSASYHAIDWEVKPSWISSQWSSGTPGRLTCQVAGVYVIVAQYRFAANATGQRGVAIQVNAVSQGGVTQVAFSTLDTQLLHTCIKSLAVGDYATCLVFQNSGGDLNGVYLSKAISLQWTKVG